MCAPPSNITKFVTNYLENGDIGGAVVSGRQEESTAAFKRFMSTAKCLSLAVCYSATCGGMATITGTGTNLIFYDNAVE